MNSIPFLKKECKRYQLRANQYFVYNMNRNSLFFKIKLTEQFEKCMSYVIIDTQIT